MSVRASMFFHVLKRGLLGRGNRPLIAFIALSVAATMITAMLSLYHGLEDKLNRDFRSYGAQRCHNTCSLDSRIGGDRGPVCVCRNAHE
jgi:hypothetical protein